MLILNFLRALVLTRTALALENIALRQQLAVLKGNIPFHLTVKGKRFFEGTLPAIVADLGRIDELLAKLSAQLEAKQ